MHHHRVGDDEVGVGVEARQQLAGVVVQVGFHLVAPAHRRVLLALVAPPEALIELGGAAVGRVRQRPRQAESPYRSHRVGVVVAVEEEGVGHDRQLLQVAPGQLVGGRRGARGHQRQVTHPLRVGDPPLDRPVPAQRRPDDQMEDLDPQDVGQARLGLDSVARGQPREARPPGASVRRRRRRARRALAAAQDVGRHHEVALGVDGPPGSHQVRPPARRRCRPASPVTWESPVSACSTRTALSRCGLSSPQVSKARTVFGRTSPDSRGRSPISRNRRCPGSSPGRQAPVGEPALRSTSLEEAVPTPKAAGSVSALPLETG